MNRLILATIAITSALILGCGRPEDPPTPSQPVQPEQLIDPVVQKTLGALDLRVAESIPGDTRYPVQPTGPRTKEEEIVTEGNTIVFRNWIQLKGVPKHLVFSQDALGTRVLKGEYVFERKRADNDLKGDLNRVAMRGPERGMLWISMSKLFPDMTEVYPSEEYHLKLYLNLEGGKSVEYQVSFHATAELPNLTLREEPIGLGDLSVMRASLLAEGSPVKIEKLTNPSGRALKVWTWAHGQMQVDSILHHQYFTGNQYAPPTGHQRWLIGSNHADVSSVVVQNERGGSMVFSLKQAAVFMIQPRETVTLIWSAALKPESACDWNFSPQGREFVWNKKGTGCGGRGADGNCDFDGSVTSRVHEQYSFIGMRMNGEAQRAIQIEELAPLAAPMSADAKTVTHGPIAVQFQVGHGFDQAHGPGPCASYK